MSDYAIGPAYLLTPGDRPDRPQHELDTEISVASRGGVRTVARCNSRDAAWLLAAIERYEAEGRTP